MKVNVTVLFVLAALILLIAAFFLGRFQTRLKMDSGVEPRFRIKEEMVILSSDGEPQGKLPAGTLIYLVSDPLGDRTSLFKVFFETDIDDMGPIERVLDKTNHRYELVHYSLKSRAWLASLPVDEEPLK